MPWRVRRPCSCRWVKRWCRTSFLETRSTQSLISSMWLQVLLPCCRFSGPCTMLQSCRPFLLPRCNPTGPSFHHTAVLRVLLSCCSINEGLSQMLALCWWTCQHSESLIYKLFSQLHSEIVTENINDSEWKWTGNVMDNLGCQLDYMWYQLKSK